MGGGGGIWGGGLNWVYVHDLLENARTRVYIISGDIEMAISHAAVKVSLVRLGASLTKTEALETLDRIPPVPDRYILLACGMGCVTRLLEQVHNLITHCLDQSMSLWVE